MYRETRRANPETNTEHSENPETRREKTELPDHFESRYVSKEEILGFDLCPADVPLAEFVNNC